MQEVLESSRPVDSSSKSSASIPRAGPATAWAGHRGRGSRSSGRASLLLDSDRHCDPRPAARLLDRGLLLEVRLVGDVSDLPRDGMVPAARTHHLHPVQTAENSQRGSMAKAAAAPGLDLRWTVVKVRVGTRSTLHTQRSASTAKAPKSVGAMAGSPLRKTKGED